MSGMKAAQEAPPLGHPLDGRFGRRLNDARLTRRTGSGLRSCSPARRSVAQSGRANSPGTMFLGGADHRLECEMRQRCVVWEAGSASRGSLRVSVLSIGGGNRGNLRVCPLFFVLLFLISVSLTC